MTIKYRKIKKQDYPYIKELVKDAWFKDYPLSEKIKYKYATGYLHFHLGNSNFVNVATIDDKLVGFIFGRVKKTSFFHKLPHYLRLSFLCFSLLFSKAGRRGIKVFRYEEKLDDKLIRPYKNDLHNEINLFIINKDYRGQGIGSTLEDSFIKFCKDNSEHHVYVYTDTYSNYEYYLHKNYKIIGSTKDFLEADYVDNDSAYYLLKKEF